MSSGRTACCWARSRPTRSCRRSAHLPSATRSWRPDGRNERTEDRLMPPTLTYPGVYVEEIPSGVHPITGVATSITAFVGRALRGPVDKAVTITSLSDFERVYGGVWTESNLGYAVQDFYRNGGTTAVIARVHNEHAAADAASLAFGSSRDPYRMVPAAAS